MKAFIDYKSYYSPEQGPYIDLQFQFVAYTIQFAPVDSVLQAKIAVSTIITSQPSGDTVYVDGFVLESPKMRDSIVEDFFDNLHIPLQPGNYTAHLTLKDILSKGKSLEGQLDIHVDEITSKVATSDILIAEVATPSSNLASPFQKSGYEIIPRISNFYSQSMTRIPYYVELYNTNLIQDSTFGLRQQVVSSQTNQIMPGFSRFTKIKPGPVVPVFRNMDISKLPSGSYHLTLEIIDKNSKTIGQPADYFFERINDIELKDENVEDIILNPAFQASLTDDSLKYYLGSLIPIARPAEVKSIIKTLKANSPDLCRKHIQQFWIQTAGNDAYNQWMIYKRNVILVEANYGNNFQSGFETDRGRVYLQYGQPNTIIVRETSPSEYPYEIWHYYKIKTFSNKRFVFYNPDLVNNAYRLLHSDMVGEQQNYKWQEMLVKRNNSGQSVDSSTGSGQFGTNSGYYYKQD
ncbi:GWxTD domain-containing protein [Fluviicola sp.]|uniref:GWxTD domain-containing protein n=1 Tax=Fluviicola sp. TaxID=1917219 RepID=UPI00260A6769|nr:GWxTD domain-containing protein [Fluviicola sp.]